MSGRKHSKKPSPILQWRSGWRTDVLKIRDGILFDSPAMPSIDPTLRCRIHLMKEEEEIELTNGGLI